MTPWEDPGESPTSHNPEYARSLPTSPTWPRVAVVVAVLLLAFVVARSCQQEQVQVSKEEAIAVAEREVNFVPENVQVRFLRQGLDRRPFWFVSLSTPAAGGGEGFSRLVVVRIDANSGEVADVEGRQESRGGGSGKQHDGS